MKKHWTGKRRKSSKPMAKTESGSKSGLKWSNFAPKNEGGEGCTIRAALTHYGMFHSAIGVDCDRKGYVIERDSGKFSWMDLAEFRDTYRKVLTRCVIYNGVQEPCTKDRLIEILAKHEFTGLRIMSSSDVVDDILRMVTDHLAKLGNVGIGSVIRCQFLCLSALDDVIVIDAN